MRILHAVACLVGILALGACQGAGPKQQMGALLGAAAGAALGSQSLIGNY